MKMHMMKTKQSLWDKSDPRFKLRVIKHDPAGMMLDMVERGELDLQLKKVQGKTALSVSLAKPKRWWNPFG